MQHLQIKFKRLTPNAVIPSKAHPTDAGFDLTATSHEKDAYGNIVYGTGIALEIPENHVGLLFPRSSNAKKDILLTNSVGVIDSGYRGEIMFKFKSIGFVGNCYDIGDRIGQIIIIPYPEVTFVETDELSETQRGNGGYGSTGK